VTPESEAPGPSAAQAVLEAENFIDTYRTIAEWIRFADAKAAVSLTVNGVLLGMLIPTLKTYLAEKSTTHPTQWWTTLVVVLFVGWLVWLVVSAVYSFLCILPLRGRGRQFTLAKAAHFHPAAVAETYPLADFDRFVSDCEKVGMTGLKREVQAAVLLDSHLSNEKYRCVTRSIWCLAASVVFGFFYLLAIQF
jgi:hypothetical protein